MLSRLVDDDEQVLPTAQELARRLATGPTIAYGQIKRQLSIGGSCSLTEALETEAVVQAICGQSADHRDATAAFIRKEKPTFRGA